MAHDLAINRTNGKASMAYVGETPWHGLGVKVDNPMTAAEAMEQAGLGYEVQSLPMYAAKPSADVAAAEAGVITPSDLLPVPTHWLNVRTDDMTPLGVVSDHYRIIQNRECFSFLDSLVGEGELRYDTAGALGRGERVWMLARVPGQLRVRSTDDLLESYLLLANSHDGSMALRCHWTTVRVVCANTFGLALRTGTGKGVTIRHTGEIGEKVNEARKVLGLAHKFFGQLQEAVDLMAGHRPSDAQVEAFFKSLYPDPKQGNAAREKAARAALWGLYQKGVGQDIPGIAGTTWAAYNAVTEFVDHHQPTRDNDGAASRRFESVLMGDLARVKGDAFDLGYEMAQGKRLRPETLSALPTMN